MDYTNTADDPIFIEPSTEIDYYLTNSEVIRYEFSSYFTDSFRLSFTNIAGSIRVEWIERYESHGTIGESIRHRVVSEDRNVTISDFFTSPDENTGFTITHYDGDYTSGKFTLYNITKAPITLTIDNAIDFYHESTFEEEDTWYEMDTIIDNIYMVSITNSDFFNRIYLFTEDHIPIPYERSLDGNAINYTFSNIHSSKTLMLIDVYDMHVDGTINLYHFIRGLSLTHSKPLETSLNIGSINSSSFYYHFYPPTEVDIINLKISDGYSFSIFDGSSYLYENETELSIMGDQLTEDKYWVIINGSDGEFILNCAYSSLPGYSVAEADMINNAGLFGKGTLYLYGEIPDDEISYYYNMTIYKGGTYEFSIFPDGDGDNTVLTPSIYVDGVSVGTSNTDDGYPKSVEFTAEKNGIATIRVYCSHYSDAGYYGQFYADLYYNTRNIEGFAKLSQEGYDIYRIGAGEVNFNITYYGVSHHVFIVDTLEGALIENALINYYGSLDKTHILYSSIGNAEISQDLFTTIEFNYTLTENTWLVIASGNVFYKLPGLVGGYIINSSKDNALITDAVDERLFEQIKSISDNQDGIWDDSEWMVGVFQDLQPDDLIDLVIYGDKESFEEDVGLLLMYGDTLENLTRAINSVNAFYENGTKMDDNILLFTLLDYESVNIVQLRYNGTKDLNIVLFSNFDGVHSNIDITIRSSHQIAFIENAETSGTEEAGINFVQSLVLALIVVTRKGKKRTK